MSPSYSLLAPRCRRMIISALVLVSGFSGPISKAQGIDHRDSLQYALQQAASLESQADVLNQLSQYYESIHADSALLYAQQAVATSQKAAYDEGTAQAYLRIASYYGHFQHYNFDSLDYYFSRSLTIYQGQPDSLRMADAYYYMSRTCNENDNYPLAYSYGENAATLYLQLGEEEKRAYALSLLCDVENHTGNNALAMKYCTSAQRIFDTLNKEGEKAALFKTMGSINFQLKNYEKSKEFFLLAIGLAQKHDNFLTLAESYVGMGQALRATQEYDDALNYFNRSLALYQQNDSERSTLGISYAYYHIGKTYLLQGNSEQALDLLEGVAETAEVYGDVSLHTLSLLELGKAYYNLDDLDQSFSYLNEATQQAQGIKGTYANVILQGLLPESGEVLQPNRKSGRGFGELSPLQPGTRAYLSRASVPAGGRTTDVVRNR